MTVLSYDLVHRLAVLVAEGLGTKLWLDSVTHELRDGRALVGTEVTPDDNVSVVLADPQQGQEFIRMCVRTLLNLHQPFVVQYGIGASSYCLYWELRGSAA